MRPIQEIVLLPFQIKTSFLHSSSTTFCFCLEVPTQITYLTKTIIRSYWVHRERLRKDHKAQPKELERLLKDMEQRFHYIMILFSFEHHFALVHNIEGHVDINMPDDATRQQHFVEWAEKLPEKQTPSWLGLPNNAEKLLLTNIGTLNYL